MWWGQIYGKSNAIVFRWLRKLLLRRSANILVYPNDILIQAEFHLGVYKESNHRSLNLLIVGRNQERKKPHRLIEILREKGRLQLRLVGKGMTDLPITHYLIENERIKIFDHTTGIELKQHFDWADLVVNPGHAGLLVMNTARHGKGILIDNGSHHAPEVILARAADQPFISFGSINVCNAMLNQFILNRQMLKTFGDNL